VNTELVYVAVGIMLESAATRGMYTGGHGFRALIVAGANPYLAAILCNKVARIGNERYL
jgi:hypothetical protein